MGSFGVIWSYPSLLCQSGSLSVSVRLSSLELLCLWNTVWSLLWFLSLPVTPRFNRVPVFIYDHITKRGAIRTFFFFGAIL